MDKLKETLGSADFSGLLSTIVSQLNKCLKFVTFRGVILYRIQSFLSPPPRIDLNFRHLLSCDTIVT